MTAVATRYCSACGAHLARPDRFCASCGARVADHSWPPPSNDCSAGAVVRPGQSEEQSALPDYRRSRTRPGFVVALGIVAGPLIAFGVYAMVSGSGPESQRDASDSYPANIEANFLNACEAGGAPASSCRCVFQRIQNQFSIEEFDALENEMTLTGAVPAAIEASVSGCGLAAPASTTPPPSALAPEALDAMSDIIDEGANFLRQAFEVDASEPRLVLDHSNGEYLCVDLRAVNRDDRDQLPRGTLTALRPSGSVSFERPVVSSGGGSVTSWFDVVAPGATTTATKCFATNGERGRFAVRWDLPVEDDLEWSFDFQ